MGFLIHSYSHGSVSVHRAIRLCLLKGIKVTDRLLLPPGGEIAAV